MTDDIRFPRRTLIRGIAAGSLLPLLGANLLGCSGGGGNGPRTEATFNHGIASGDPLTDRVIIWTRVTPERPAPVRVEWELATDPDFSDIVGAGRGNTDDTVDYTVKVDVEGLEPGQTYYYRFRVRDRLSPVGTTRTLPVGSVAAVSFAVLSCSNYPAGYFNVYREVSQLELDAVLHLGDYIYEYARDGYASQRAEEFGRVSEPAEEILSLADYRVRYGQYRTDADLQAAHAAHPFIVVWDDHEIANDSWREGAENHDPASEGDFAGRRAAAIQAWYEWLPVRPPTAVDEVIYRRFEYGDLVDLLMLDTRQVGRDRQLAYADYSNGGTIDVASARAATVDPARTLMGREQLDWLKARLTESNARWQVLGQQVLMGRMVLPSPIIEALDPDNPDLAGGTAAVLTALAAKNKPPEQRTAEEQALLDSAIPYNLDAWDGYGFERDDLYFHARQVGSRLIGLAGDTHNAWANQLTAPDGSVVGAEFATASVSSPGLEDFLGEDTARGFASLMVTLIDDLRYANLVERGYLTVRFTPAEAAASWRFVDRIDATDYAVDDSLSMDMSVSAEDLGLG